MTEVLLKTYKNLLRIKIESDSDEFIKKIKDHFTYKVKDYYWSPKYQAGVWNGKTCFIAANGTFPYGLLPDFLRKHKASFPDVKLKVDDEVKGFFTGDDFELKFDLSLYPRPYQKESVEYCLKYTKGIIRSATASGKSLVISYIIKNLMDNRDVTHVRRAVVIVPSKFLVEQFYTDMGEYGLNQNYIGRIHSDIKEQKDEWTRAVVLTTWQTLKNNTDNLKDYDVIIGDECHGVKAHELKKIFSKCFARYRFGFTGTMPTHPVEEFNTKSFIGPVLREYPSGLLAEQGYISKCNVKVINIEYSNQHQGSYIEIKSEVFNNKYRLNLIEDITNNVDDNILLLVGLIKEGRLLETMLKRKSKKKVMFLSGKDSVALREEWRQKMMTRKDIALIATYGIFQQGINIPSLKYASLVAPYKSKIRVLQSIGRTLRLAENKEDDGAFIFDFIDDVKYLRKHGKSRIKFYESEDFNIDEFFVKEGEPFSLLDSPPS
jgi:superfamily II DNA or RNA helicase